MTKADRIRRMYEDGVRNLKTLASRAGVSCGYAANIVHDIRNPGSLTEKSRKWRRSKPASHGTAAVKRWRKRHPEWTRKFRRRQHRRFQAISRTTAWERYRGWTMRQIRFLRRNRGRMTVREIATQLGRTFAATREAMRRYGREPERYTGSDWNIHDAE
ncbi:MAG TPA: hypothetical protein VD862_03440 [Candidatus Paceibacterota bacterium]|nr:hypothetical protein [Candidatus Paceibacterota bacterium]